jgi:hypothetical protein
MLDNKFQGLAIKDKPSNKLGTMRAISITSWSEVLGYPSVREALLVKYINPIWQAKKIPKVNKVGRKIADSLKWSFAVDCNTNMRTGKSIAIMLWSPFL